ncbi:MAG: Rrf2 family transcriptional regulator [Bryobacterales bacterium]|nr:Rrf2 family transcriptional regulator [Bryobacterales bacterium]
MVNKTSISAVRALLFLAQQDASYCASPRRLAESLDESPTYLAKVVRHLVRSGILEAEKGVKGGVRLIRKPADITLLAIVESCQGVVVGDFCRGKRPEPAICSFHRAALELHNAITSVLGRWTLGQLLEKPGASGSPSAGIPCLIGFGAKAPLASHLSKQRQAVL